MTMKVGDSVFLPRGETAVVTEHDKHLSTFKISADPAFSAHIRRHGYINGMTPEQRTSLMTLMDRVKEIEDPQSKVQEIRTKLEELRADPRQWQMARYVESELAHVMNVYGVKPTSYTSDLGLLKDAT
ncbi:MAG: hypothetical protein RIQ81_1268 [Pseudomonadota bacterium]|jgi:hypothetical protein